jgi:aminoglycoside phosphotransferase (APT) family kinase protein
MALVADAGELPGPLAAALQMALRRRFPGVEVGRAERMAGGASRVTWRLVLRGAPPGHQTVVVRTNPEGAPPADLAVEGVLLEAAHQAGLPVPEVLAQLPGPPAALVLAFVDGEVLPRRVLGDASLTEARAVLAGQCGQALARLHRLPTERLSQVTARPQLAQGGADAQLAMVRRLLDDLGQPHPALELGWRWLTDHLPPAGPLVLVHGDFRTGNLIVGPDGLRAVLDWELAHLGDPLEDLGWLCTPAWRFGSPLPVGGFGTLEDLVAGYETAGGPPVDLQALAWWTAFGSLRWGALSTLQAITHVRGARRSLELAAIGRRVCETEADLLDALDQLAPIELPDAGDDALPPDGVGDDALPPDGVGDDALPPDGVGDDALPPDGVGDDALPPDGVGDDALPPDGASGSRPEVGPGGPARAVGLGGWLPHDLPRATDLLEAVAEHLEGELAGQLTGRQRFLVRVAANVVRVVAREVHLGPALEAEHRARLEALGVVDDAELASALREGRLSSQSPRVRHAVRAAVEAKLAVANPQRLTTSAHPASEPAGGPGGRQG